MPDQHGVQSATRGEGVSSSRGHVARRAGVGVLILFLVVGATALGLWLYTDANIERRDIAGVGDQAAGTAADRSGGQSFSPPPALSRTVNVLVVGTDSREGLSPQQLVELGTERVAGERADVVMLVHLSPDRRQPVVVAFPRDLRVDIPENGSSNQSGADIGKLNAALARGGPELVVDTVESLTGIGVDHYVQVDIAGFLDLVDIVDGVPVCLDQPLVDRRAGAAFAAGRQLLNGTEAAAYVRARHTDPRGDVARIQRQFGFLRQTMRRTVTAGTLVNPLRMKRLVDAAAGAVLTDVDFQTTTMARIAWSLRDVAPATVDMHLVPSETERIDGTSYQVIDSGRAGRLFRALRTSANLPGPDDAAGDDAAGNVPPAAAVPSSSPSPRPGECT